MLILGRLEEVIPKLPSSAALRTFEYHAASPFRPLEVGALAQRAQKLLAHVGDLGARFANEPGKFGRLLHERKSRGLLTVGFSAGADQLCEYIFRRSYDPHTDTKGFGLMRNSMITLHHDSSRNNDIRNCAVNFGHMRVFGLPNDSALNGDWGVLSSGSIWQVYEFVLDRTWDIPNEQFHIRTRHGGKIEHFDPEGRHWGFDHGDHLVRITSPDGRNDEGWIVSRGSILNYWSRTPSRYDSIAEILAAH